jgi:hypothetical protein
MNNKPFIVSATGAAVMGFDFDFHNWAVKNGIRDPFKVSQDLFSKRCKKNADGSISVELRSDDLDEPIRVEKDRWIRMRDEYIARRCFYEIGYDAFLERTESRGSAYDIDYMRNDDEFLPCRSADRQCSLFCKWIGECDNGRRVNGNR